MSRYCLGDHVSVFYGHNWCAAVVVKLPRPERCGWWPGVDFTRAVALRFLPGQCITGAGRGDFDVLVPDPDSDLLRPIDARVPRRLGVVS